MQLVYFSKTGNTRRFINKLNQNFFPQMTSDDYVPNNDIILITYTTGYGEIPDEVQAFCNQHNENIKYVIASGNRNWGHLFARSGDLIASNYNASLLYKFELSGTTTDVQQVTKILENIYNENDV